jgi:hypothetical protein
MWKDEKLVMTNTDEIIRSAFKQRVKNGRDTQMISKLGARLQ